MTVPRGREPWFEPWGVDAYQLIERIYEQLWRTQLAAAAEALALARRDVAVELLETIHAARPEGPGVFTRESLEQLLQARVDAESERLQQIRQAS